MGDLTVNKEFDLMCPTNRLGTVDLWVVSHHGQAISNSEVLVHAIQPRVAILNNGTRKGGQPDAMKIIHSAPRLQDLWQLHFSQLSGQEYTVPGMFIANTVDDQPAAIPIAAIVAPAPGRWRRAAAGSQRHGVLDQGVRRAGRIVHRHQRAQRIHQDLQGGNLATVLRVQNGLAIPEARNARSRQIRLRARDPGTSGKPDSTSPVATAETALVYCGSPILISCAPGRPFSTTNDARVSIGASGRET